MTDIQGPNPHQDLSIHDRYRNDLQHGAKLFQEALQSYETTKDADKKIEFKKVMDESLNAIHQAVVCLKNEGLSESEKKLQMDYSNVEKKPNLVKEDIDILRKKI